MAKRWDPDRNPEQRAELDRWIQRVLADAPPLPEATRARLVRLLSS